MDKKYIHKRSYSFFLGIFLCLLMLSLAINVGYVMRTLAFPFIYLFGAVSYLLYPLIFVYGITLVINRSFKLSKKTFIPGLILLSIGIMILWTLCILWNNDFNANAFDSYNNLIFGDPGYYDKNFLNVFARPFGGGVIGYLSTFGFVRLIGKGWTLAICIVLVLLGGGLVFSKQLKLLVLLVLRKHKENVEEKERIERTKDITEFEMKEFNDKEIFQQAKTVGEDEVGKVIVPSQMTTMNFDQRNTNDSTSIEIKENMRETGTIIKPVFSLTGERDKHDISEVATTPKPVFMESEKEENNVENTIVSAPEIPEKEPEIENVELDFDAKREFDEELLKEKPEFLEPVVKEQVNSVNNEIEERPAVSNTITKVEPTIIEEEKPAPTVVKKEPIHWVPPSTDLLNVYETQSAQEANEAAAIERMACINQMFEDFKIQADASGFTIGPSITRFHINYASNGLVKSVESKTTDLSVRLSGLPVRFEARVPGYSYSGIEVPNAKITTVSFKECVETLGDPKEKPFNVAFGKNITGEVIAAEFDKFPHLLVSGGTGSGKSVFVNSIITTLIMRASPEILRMVMVDPKRVEFNRYKGIPHLLCPVANEPLEALKTMRALVREMEERYRIFEDADGATNIKEYNQYCERNNKPKMYYILSVLDEFADLIDCCKEVMEPVTRLAQKARACGIMLFIATQRPTVNIITGTIKANLPVRVALTANSGSDSMVILDEYGAEDLLGNGDMLVKTALISRSGPVRLQGCFIQPNEMLHVITYLKEHYPTHYEETFMGYEQQAEEEGKEYVESGNAEVDFANANQDKYESIKEWVMTQDTISMSRIQRYCGVGFARAGKMLDRLVDEGIVDRYCDGNKGNKVLVHEDRFYNGPDVDSGDQIG